MEEQKTASLAEIRDYFEMTSGDFASEWKRLNDEEKRFFKEEVTKVIDK